MLTAAALGMLLYGLHDVVAGTIDLVAAGTLEWWANLWRMLAGATLMLAAVFVRVSIPGGLALAIAGLLGLQSISLHNDVHFYGSLLPLPQIMRAIFSALLVTLAYFGWGGGGGDRPRPTPDPPANGSAPGPDARSSRPTRDNDDDTPH